MMPSGHEEAASPDERKLALRRRMRAVRRELVDRPERSERIWRQVCSLTEVRAATALMVFTSIPSEPDTAPFIEWCRANDKLTAVPEDDVDPAWPDVVIVPGLAFTPDGRRCGQGGGWYDRFLPGLPRGATTIGVAFAPQLVDDLPTEPHDVVVDIVVTA